MHAIGLTVFLSLMACPNAGAISREASTSHSDIGASERRGQQLVERVDLAAEAPLLSDELLRDRLAGKVLLMVGAPGSGKDTQAKVLEERFGMLHFSTGQLIRDAIKEGTISEEMKAAVNRGELVPDEYVKQLLRDRLQNADRSKGIILNGFPRNIPQLRDLQEILEPLGLWLDAAVHLDVSEAEAVARLSNRKDSRKDDVATVIRNRFKVYAEQTQPLIAELRRMNLLRTVPSQPTIQETTDKMLQVLAKPQATNP